MHFCLLLAQAITAHRIIQALLWVSEQGTASATGLRALSLTRDLVADVSLRTLTPTAMHGSFVLSKVTFVHSKAKAVRLDGHYYRRLAHVLCAVQPGGASWRP